ncbi:MAG: methylmalonyl Co-A mutase-associated GTPase MeaB [Acidimicrobiales bacterium]
MTDIEVLADGVRRGDRRSLARAITLVESQRPDQRVLAIELLDALLPATGAGIRVGISGPPGVGKSTLIEALGIHVVREGHRVAVLAIDPSSTRSGGSILGDKTRMELLARETDAYIRPSPSSGVLGGVARRTREAMVVCEAAGFDVVVIETVGVGQSEVDVDDMVDTFVLLVAAGGGDELQGIKRGVTEMADIVAVTKADGELLVAAQRAASDHRNALHLLRPRTSGWSPPVLLCSASTDSGINELWATVGAHRAALEVAGALEERRAAQARRWLWAEVRDSMLRELLADPEAAHAADELEREVVSGALSPTSAAQRLLEVHGRPSR